MKTRVFQIALAGGLWLGLAAVQAHRAPALAPLPDFDKREAGGPRPAGFRVVPAQGQFEFAPAQRAAAATLRNRLPNAQIEPSRFTRSPRLVTAERGFLTGVNGTGGAISAANLNAIPAGDPQRVVKAFVREHQTLFGHGPEALDRAAVKREFVAAHNGLRTTIWQQEHAGIPVFEALFQSHVTKRGELARVSSQFLADPARAVANGAAHWASLAANPPVSLAEAVARAGADVGAELDSVAVRQLEGFSGAELKTRARAPKLNGDVHAQLVWLPLNADSARLCWQVIFVSQARREMFRTLVDAETGEVMLRHNLTRYQALPGAVPGTYRVYTSDSPSPFTPGWPAPNVGQPPLQPRTLVTNIVALSLTASPAGWLNPPSPLAGYNTTGNNVDAHTDLDDDDEPDVPRPASNLDPPVFDFAFGPLGDDTRDLLLQAPVTYTNASVVNLFYWNNYMHDRLYELGFTEAAGNFQNNNFGRGGLGNDAVQADALDGALLNDPFHRNNANFYPPPDGIPGRMQMYVFDGPVPNRDGSLDSEVVCHEYTHGLTDRLVGGGVGITALQTAGMGEGWSDFYPLCLLSEPSDDPRASYPSGGFASYLLYDLTENYYFGIRRYPYSTDMTKNPLTFKDIDPTQADEHFGIPFNPIFGNAASNPSEVHNQGEVWCITLWEVRANLVDTYGWHTGNQLALQLVTDGLKLCPPNPTFLEARDAIVQADQILTGGANEADIWVGFAKRGMGYSARAPRSSTTVGVIEAFDLPPGVGPQPPTGVLNLSVVPPDRSTIFGGAPTNVFVLVRDGVGVTNATVTAKVNGVIDLPVNNAGTPPDARPGDSVYTALLQAPDTATNITLFINAEAPDKTNATLNVTYYIARQPANDMFNSRLKVPAQGAFYNTNNRFATTEPGEPPPAGTSNFVSSLWWTWTPTNNSRVLVDTAGSAFRSVVAVYTGTSITNLKEVKAVAQVPERRQSYLYFDAVAGQAYQISISGAGPANSGLLRLRIAPNGQPDITPPVISVVTPPSGYIWTNNVIDVVAEAVDPEPLSSGVDQITFRVSPRQFGPDVVKSALATGTTGSIALTEGRNTITVTATDGSGNASSTNIVVTYRRPEPYNDHFVQAGTLAGDNGTVTVANALATREPGEPRHAGNNGGKSVWWRFKAPSDGVLLLSTEGTGFDTVMGLYTGDRVNALQTLASNDDAFEGSLFSKIRQAVRANRLYSIAVDGFNAATGRVQLAYAFSPAQLYTVKLTQTAGGLTFPPAGDIDVEAGSSLQLYADPDPGYEFAGWEGDILTTENPVPVPVTRNLAIRATFRPQPVADDFESGGLTRLPWQVGGALPWVVTDQAAFASRYSARSGQIGHSQFSSLKLTHALRAGAGSFDFKVSSEAGWDFLEFYVDGVLLQRWSGEVEWTKFEFAVTAGTHTLEWRYVKDAANSRGLDAAFVDNVALPLAVPDDGTTPTLSIGRAFTGGVQVRLKGQTNQVYVIQAAESLPARWRGVYTNVATSGEVIFIDPESVALPQRFYRGVRP
jgi:hypothetical protein